MMSEVDIGNLPKKEFRTVITKVNKSQEKNGCTEKVAK